MIAARLASSFNDMTGDVLLEGERVFTLGLHSGVISGSPSPFLFKGCPNQALDLFVVPKKEAILHCEFQRHDMILSCQARCSKHVQCTIYGLLGFSGARLETSLAVSAFDDVCWAKVETGHFEVHQQGCEAESVEEIIRKSLKSTATLAWNIEQYRNNAPWRNCSQYFFLASKSQRV